MTESTTTLIEGDVQLAPLGVRPQGNSGAIELRRQSAIVAIGRRAVASPGAELLLQDAAELLAETVDADFSGVGELVGTGAIRLGLHDRRSDKQTSTLGHEYALDQKRSLAAYALEMAHPVRVDDLQSDNRFVDDFLARHQVRSAIATPLRLLGRSYGVLAVYSKQPHRFADEDALFMEAISHLMTTTLAREQAEKTLESERRLLTTLLENVESLVIVLSPEGRLIDINRACQRTVGFTLEELRDRPVWSALLIPEEAAMVEGAFAQLIDGQTAVVFDSHVLTKQGERRLVAWTFTVDRDEQGRPTSIVGTGQDTTEQHLLASRIEELQAAWDEQPLVSEASSHKHEAAATETAHARPFERVTVGAEGERRRHPRRAYPYRQSIAPMFGNKLPPRDAFREVQCIDIAAGGFSFLATQPPAEQFLVAAFGAGSAITYLIAHIVHVTRIQRGDATMYMVGCTYTGRAAY